MTVLEAQINGMVCVGINARGMKDLIINGYNGFLSDINKPELFANNIIKIISDDELKNKMMQNVNEMVKQHNLPDVISIWQEAYNVLIDEKTS